MLIKYNKGEIQMSKARMQLSPETTLKEMLDNNVTIGELANALTMAMAMQQWPQVEQSSDTRKERDVRIAEILRKLSVPAHLKGYPYLRTAISLSMEDDKYIDAITKWMYPTVAETHNTTPSRVERAIRHAIEVAWKRGDEKIQKQYFGYTISSVKGYPTNNEFIAMLVDHLKMEET